jgi:hypothetical protein
MVLTIRPARIGVVTAMTASTTIITRKTINCHR